LVLSRCLFLPSVSRQLYSRAASGIRKLTLYDGSICLGIKRRLLLLLLDKLPLVIQLPERTRLLGLLVRLLFDALLHLELGDEESVHVVLVRVELGVSWAA
jgi:hypothetical protein